MDAVLHHDPQSAIERDTKSVEPRIEEAFNQVLLQTLRVLIPALAALYLIFAYFHGKLLDPASAAILTPLALGTAAVFGLVGLGVRHARFPQAWAHPAATLVASICVLNTLVHMHVTDDARQTTLLLLLIVGGGALLLQRRSVFVITMATVGGWIWAVAVSETGLDWQHNAFAILSAVLLSWVTHLGRVSALERLHNLHLKELSQRQSLQQVLVRRAFYDDLTGLPNRLLLSERISDALRTAHNGCSLAILFIDLDAFKTVNDTLGHQAGDDLITSVSSRLAASVPSGGTIARVGGDEFVVLDPTARNSSDARRAAESIQQSLRTPIVAHGVEHFVTASIGIALAGPGCQEPEALLRDADTAMYEAKRAGAGQIECFRQHMHDDAKRTLQVRNELHRAIERGELRLVYQPQFSLPSGEISGVEALIRWERTGARGAISPAEFIPLAEESGLIVEIGDWVIERSCQETLELHKLARRPLTTAINLSVRQLGEGDFAAKLAKQLEKIGFDPTLIELEITEGFLLGPAKTVENTLAALSQLGVSLAIDDFGTGYSALSYLTRLPFSTLKIDRSFLTAERTEHGDAIVHGIVALGHATGKTVIAEGVETAEHLRLLNASSCDEGQGYFLSRPLAIDALCDGPLPRAGLGSQIGLAGISTHSEPAELSKSNALAN